MKHGFLALLLLAGCTAPEGAPPPAPAATRAPQGFWRPDPVRHPDLYAWTDTCTVYVLKDGDSAVLIDLGSGEVLSALQEIGVKSVDWVLFTHHHREQCQGAPRLQGTGAKIGGPAAERELFEQPEKFRKMTVRLGDPFTIHGSSYVRPPVHPVLLDRAFSRMDVFEWKGREFRCIDTRGNSPGSMSYFLKEGGRWLAFSGDLMLEGARLHTWFDSEWDYGFAAGIYALANSAGQVEGYDPEWLLPSHGRPIREAAAMLREFQRKLRALERLYVRGYDVNTFSGSRQDPTSRPTVVPNVWQVLPHLYKFRGPNFYPNCCLVIADSGHALAVDCGLFDEKFLDASIALMKERLGLRQIDVMIPTHMHGDHFLQGPHLRKTWGAKLWALDRMQPMCEHPERFDYSASIQAYGQLFEGAPIEGVRFDRLFRDGESFEWEGYRFTIDWMPGQTEFALAVRGMIDGRSVVFTGDNIFGDPEDPRHTGHEAVVAHNSSVLEEGYILGAEYLSRVKPDLLMGGHSYVMDRPAAFIERYRRWAYEMRDAFQGLIAEEDYRYGYDPFWVRVEPYRLKIRPGETKDLSITVRNFGAQPQRHRIRVDLPAGLAWLPDELTGDVPPQSRTVTQARVTAAGDATPGVRLLGLDVSRDGRRYGEWFDAVVEVVR
ncbi:MAG TPA: MBL fold metallo-hydrolase [Planctomycetota bacterium]|nr:MBL fold metallo-hydrolase [Planctomycetota bacterium]